MKEKLLGLLQEKLAQLKGLIPELLSALKGAPSAIVHVFKELKTEVRSEDGPTRRHAIFVYLMVIACVVALIKLGNLGYQRRKERIRLEQEIAAQIAAEKAEAEERARQLRPPATLSLGSFSLELRQKPGQLKMKNSTGTAEMEIVIACSEPEVCEWIESRIQLARAELSPLFVPLERDRLLTLAGKRAFREEIRDTLNRWLEAKGIEGQIVEVLLPRFIMS